MVFSNLIFLYLFLPLCLAAYFLVRSMRARNTVLLLFSLVFYAWGEPVYLLLMIAVAAVNWGFGLLLGRERKKLYLILAVVLDLGALAVFKYAGFVVENLNALFSVSMRVPSIALPIGISFYTFQALSYTIDVWRGQVQVQRSFKSFLLYVSLFPQLIAGPIVRYQDIEAQIDARETKPEEIFYGTLRFAIGLAKKVLLADYAGKTASSILDGPLAVQTTAAMWLGLILYTFEIYFDFSGYSDMAIGMGHMFGFRYPENFRLPYTAQSITEFWRRWHISLSSFFRDYVYIPLGGNRRHQILNMAVVWLLTGLWHGASWNFVLWGAYFFVFLTIEKLLGSRIKRIPAVLRHLGTMLLVVIGWNIFYFTDTARLGESFRVLFGLAGAGFWDAQTGIRVTNALPLLAVCTIGCTAVPQIIGSILGGLCAEKKPDGAGHIVYTALSYLFILALLALSTVALVGTSYNAFLYFRF